ncbi:MAG: D-alanine--D-alanine ligase [bacterium]|nr:D-alanine--D-alanine ligase [bacterium]
MRRQRLRIAVLFGGWGEEKEISVQSGRFVIDNLDKRKYEVIGVAVKTVDDLIGLKGRADYVFIALHGRLGEGGYVQALLDMMGLSYSSAGPLASQIGMNKVAFKRVLKSEKLPTIDDVVLDYDNDRVLIGDKSGYAQVSGGVDLGLTAKLIDGRLGYPVFVKPADSGSSFGVSRVEQASDVKSAVDKAKRFGRMVIIEKEVAGDELTVSFVGKTILPPILIKPKKGVFFNYESKYTNGGAEEICPAPVPMETEKVLKRLSLKIKQAVGVETYGRVDFMMDKKTGGIYPLEINTIPGMTKTSLLPKAAAAFGWPPERLLDEIISAR